MSVPNALTVSRLILALALIAALASGLPYSKSLALVLFVVAGITDYFDGYLARTRYGVSPFGQLMDPLTDKVLICSAFVALVEQGVVSAWIVVVIVAREFLVTGLRLLAANEGKVLEAGRWGKHKMVGQIVGVTMLLLGLAIRDDLLRAAWPAYREDFAFAFRWFALAVSIAVAGVTLVSGAMYYLEHRAMLRRQARSLKATVPAA